MTRRSKIIRTRSLADVKVGPSQVDTDPSVRFLLVYQLNQLPKREREVVALRFICDMPEREVAALLGVSVGTVKSSASRGVSKLRQALSQEESKIYE